MVAMVMFTSKKTYIGFGRKVPIIFLSNGFTIVELLVVVAIIGVLTTISVVVYSGVHQNAVKVAMQSDLSSAADQLSVFKYANSKYPETIDCSIPDSTTNMCIKMSNGSEIQYSFDNNSITKTYVINASNGNINYRIATDSVPKACPSNFVIVPGSKTYGTSDFCVMKYEARQVGATDVPISTPDGLPWTRINRNSAITNSSKVANCTDCHLINEAERLTIDQNILSVASNWSGGAVGSGYVYSGHNDSDPNNPIAADADDNNGYAYTNNASGTQRRTLKLSNGETIWDLSGNVFEWSSGDIPAGSQPGVDGETGYVWKEWKNVSVVGTLSPNVSPIFGTPAAAAWDSTNNGIGSLYSYTNDTEIKAYLWGGHFAFGNLAGVAMISMISASNGWGDDVGFRVTCP